MSRRIDTSIASIQFQVNARQANAAMQALQNMSNDLNREIDKVKKNIENLGSGAVKENPTFVELDNQLKGLESNLRDVMKAQKDFMRGAKAADQLWKAASEGNIESLSFRSIRTGINGLKKRQEGLQPGDAQDMKDYRIIKQVIEEADRVVKAAGNDVQNVVQTIREGGKVSEQTMRQTINTLRDLKGSVDETDADFVAWGKDLDFMEAKMQDFNEAQRRAKGEIVDYDDAVKEMNKLTADGAKAAKEQTAAAEKKIETLKEENETLAKNRAEIKENIRLTQEEMDNQQKSIEQKHREIEAREQLWAEDQRPAYEGSIDDAKRKAQAERELADEKQRIAEEQIETEKYWKHQVTETGQKITDIKNRLAEIQQQKPAPNPVLEGVSAGAEKASVDVDALKKKLDDLATEKRQLEGKMSDFKFDEDMARAYKPFEDVFNRLQSTFEKIDQLPKITGRIIPMGDGSPFKKSMMKANFYSKGDIDFDTAYAQKEGEITRVMQDIKDHEAGYLGNKSFLTSLKKDYEAIRDAVSYGKNLQKIEANMANPEVASGLQRRVDMMEKLKVVYKEIYDLALQHGRTIHEKYGDDIYEERIDENAREKVSVQKRLNEIDQESVGIQKQITEATQQSTQATDNQTEAVKKLAAAVEQYKSKATKMSDKKYNEYFSKDENAHIFAADPVTARNKLERAFVHSHSASLNDEQFKESRQAIEMAKENLRRQIFEQVRSGEWSLETLEAKAKSAAETLKSLKVIKEDESKDLNTDAEYQARKFYSDELQRQLKIVKQLGPEMQNLAAAQAQGTTVTEKQTEAVKKLAEAVEQYKSKATKMSDEAFKKAYGSAYSEDEQGLDFRRIQMRLQNNLTDVIGLGKRGENTKFYQEKADLNKEAMRRYLFNQISSGQMGVSDIEEQIKSYKLVMDNIRALTKGQGPVKDNAEYQTYKFVADELKRMLEIAKQLEPQLKAVASAQQQNVQANQAETEAIQKKNQELERTKSYIELEKGNISRNQQYYDQAIKDLKEMGLAEKDITDQAKIQEAIEKKTLEIMEAEVNAEKEAAEQRRELVSKITSSQLGGSKADQDFYAKHAGEYELSQYKDTDEIMERIAHLEMVSKLKNGKRFSDDTHWDPDDEVDEDELYVMTDEEKEAALNELRILKQHIREELLKTLNIEGDLDKAVQELTGGDGFSEDAKFGEQLNDKIQSIKEKIDEKIQTSLDKYDDIVNMEYREAFDDNGKLDKEKVRRNVAEYIEDTIQEASGSMANIKESQDFIKEYEGDVTRLNGGIEKLNQTEAKSNQQDEEELRLKGELEQAQKDLTASKENQNKAEQESIRLQGEAAEQGRIAAKAEGEYAQAEADMVEKKAEINRQQDEALADIDKMGQGYEGLKTKMEGYEQQLEENGKAYAKNAQEQAEAEQEKQQAQQLTIKRMEDMIAVMRKKYDEEATTDEQRTQIKANIERVEAALRKARGGFESADEVLQRFNQHMAAGKEAGESMAQTLDNQQESMRLTQEQMQEGIKLLEQEYIKTDYTTKEGIKRREQLREAIEQMNAEIKIATGEWMSLADARKLAGEAEKNTFLDNDGKGFTASAQDIQKATQALERQRDALLQTIKAKRDNKNLTKEEKATLDQEEAELTDLTNKLKALKFEQDNFNMSQAKMQELMRNPVNAVNLDELRAAIKRADGELKRMEGSLDKNNEQYKAFAEQVRNAKNMLKEMEGQAKASATAWEKAWSRLKTYVVMYMGFNAVWQKMVGTADDIMELSDKMGEVRKTTGFTADEVGRLSDKLAELDTRTGLTNLMSISAKAGQLGLKNMEDVMGFTEAANKLMVALPEMGEEAATQMMKVAIATGEVNKIQKEMDEGVTEGSSATAVALERIGSTIDQLRANSAAAAPQITDFVKRVGAVGAQSNISIDQVAALGSTVDALGMRVEMSATALSRMIPAIKRNAFEVAKAIGMAPNALRQMFDEAGGGMNAMLAIFQHIKDAGMNADDIEKMMGMGGMTDIMKDLNQQGARAGIVFAGLSQNVDELRRQLGVAKTAYEENIAIQNEYDKMNETTAAKWERLSNKIEEVFVGDASQNALGVIIDGLRTIIDLITGPLSTAFNTTVLAVTAIKTGLTEIPSKIGGFFDYLKESAMKAGEELQKAANATGDIAKAAEGIEGAGDAVSDISDALGDAQEAGEQAGEAMETATGAIEGMTGATRVSIFSVQGLKTAWKGLDTTMKANIIVAVVALLYTLGKALYNALTETSKYSKAVADANAMIQIAIDRFEGYWEKLKETAAALDRAKKSTEGLKEGSDQLTKATIDLTKADNANKAAIADINSIYGKYLGFMLTEANYANLSAAAHDKVAAAIRREMLAKQQQAAIDQVTQENTENLKDGLANLTEELREDGRLNNQEAAKAKSAVQKFMRENIKFNTASGEYEVSQQAYQYLTGKGANLDKLKGLNPNQLAAGWFYEYLKENFHLNDAALADITGVFPQGGSYRKTNVGGRNFRGDYASAYLDNMQDVAEVQDVFAGDLGDAQKEDRKATTKLVEKLKKQADAAKAKITDKSTSEKERNAAYEDLANALEGLDGSIDQLNPAENKTLIDAVKKQADDISKSVDKDKLLRARTNARSIFARATGSENGYTPEVPLTPESNPWGEKLGADSTDWKNMTAEQLVNRRKQMKDFVNAIQTDSDVKTVLAEDAALKKAIENGMSADMRTVIEWYNTERLKIQDELHARYLTNTGDWMDPKKVKARKKLLHDETRMFLDELDAYYTERKAKIQEAAVEEGISEAEVKNRTLANEAEWRQRRMELQKMYGDKAEEVTQESQDKIFNIISERTGDDVKVVKGMYQKTLDFVEKVSKMGEQGEKEAREFRAKMDKQAMQDLLKEQNAMHQQMKAIQDVIDKERPFNGITKNLRENLVTMGILTADMTEERNRLMAEGADMADFNARQAAEELKRTAFMLGEAENAYTTTIEDIMKRMADAGMTAWADELKANPKMREALIAQLHQTYDDIQEAIKKEASLMKKHAENMWNNILLPGGDGKTTVKDAFEQAISQLGIDQGRVSRANSLIGAGATSERVADRLAIKQMKLQLTMQEHYFNLMRKQGQQRIDDLKRQADELERQGELEKASRVRQDKAHAEMSLRLATTKEQTELLKQQEDIIARTEESQNRLYKELREWGDLLASSMRDLMEASNAGNAEYYNELAKLNLTGKGGPGAGTYIVIDNEGTSDAKAHYEYLDERQALERQHEIEQENARAEAWKKVWDDLNAKMNEQITDWMNAALQNESIDSNTSAVNANTAALNNLTWAMQTENINKATRTDDNKPNTTIEKIGYETPDENETPIPFTQEGLEQRQEAAWAYGDTVISTNEQIIESTNKVQEAFDRQFHSQVEGTKSTNKLMQQSTQSTFAKMTAAANLYGIAYQTMSNDNLDASQKFELFALQAAGNAAIGMLTTNLFKQEADQMVKMPGILGELLGQMPYPVAMATYAAVTALMGGLMGMAVSKVAKSKSQIAQVTGASASAGRLATGMLTYAEGNVNEFTDPGSLTPGRQYNVDGRDGKTYRARYMGEGAKTHITNGPEFHLVGEKGREAIIDAHTTRNIQLNEPEIWGAIKTLYNGGSLRHSTRRRGVRAFADGNLDEFEMADGGSMMAEGMDLAAVKDSLDRNSAVQEALLERLNEPIVAQNILYGPDGLPAILKKLQKEANRHGEKFL